MREILGASYRSDEDGKRLFTRRF